MAKLDKVHPLAIDEASDARRWYEDQSAAAAAGFDRELAHAFQLILERPESFPNYLKRTQRCLLNRYPFLVVFRETPGGTFIIAIAHCSRKPGYWKVRLA